MYHFDIFPTILYGLGFRFPDNRLGLGISGFGSETSAREAEERRHYIGQLLNYSPKYLEFWKLTDRLGQP